MYSNIRTRRDGAYVTTGALTCWELMMMVNSTTTSSAPSVSVVTTVRNGSRFLQTCYESIVAQSLTSWEWILVDDSSTDNSLPLMQNIAAQDRRVRVSIAPQSGRSNALNHGLVRARSSLVTILDVDDVLHESNLAIMSGVFDGSPGTDVLSCAPVTFASSPHWPSEDEIAASPVHRDLLRKPRLDRGNPMCHSGLMMNRHKIIDLGGYDNRLHAVVDYDLWVRAAISQYVLRIVDLPLVGKRIHRAQSFERSGHLVYVWNGLKIQYRLLRHRPTASGAAFMLGRLVWSLLPRRIRLGARQILARF